MRLRWLAALWFLVGCAPDAPSDEIATDSLLRQGHRSGWGHKVAGPCLLGGWGEISAPSRSLHVRADGSDVDGDGSIDNPFATVDAAWASAGGTTAGRGQGAWHSKGNHYGWGNGNERVRIAVGPGTFSTALHLQADDPRLILEGCSASETTLEAPSPGASILDVDGHDHGSLKGVTLAGGRRALRVRNGGDFDVRDVSIESSLQVAVLVEGHRSRLDLQDTDVVVPLLLGDRGWGIAVIDDGELDMRGGGVYGATGIGIFGDASTLALTDIEVMDTAPSGRFGELGRGLHVQNRSSLDLTGGLFRNNADASIFLHDPRRAVITGIVIDITSAGIVIDFPSTGLSGDGIVVFGGSERVELNDNLITGSERAALLFDGVDATLSGNETDDSGLVIGGFTMFTQEDADVDGPDAAAVYDLQGPLMLNTWALDPAPLSSDH